jgi:YHS domain-containing protein
VLDSAHRVVVNQELFYFADAKDARKFRKDPLKNCGPLTDPVAKRRFTPSKTSPRMTWMGRDFFFESEDTRKQFAAMPDSFAIRSGM